MRAIGLLNRFDVIDLFRVLMLKISELPDFHDKHNNVKTLLELALIFNQKVLLVDSKIQTEVTTETKSDLNWDNFDSLHNNPFNDKDDFYNGFEDFVPSTALPIVEDDFANFDNIHQQDKVVGPVFEFHVYDEEGKELTNLDSKSNLPNAYDSLEEKRNQLNLQKEEENRLRKELELQKIERRIRDSEASAQLVYMSKKSF